MPDARWTSQLRDPSEDLGISTPSASLLIGGQFHQPLNRAPCGVL